MPFCPNSLSEARHLTIDNIENTEIQISQIHGFGLFATDRIRRGTILCFLDGQVIDKAHYAEIFETLKPEVQSISSFLFMECNYISDTQILARPFRTKYSYINHAFAPNVQIQEHPKRLFVTQDIPNGVELTLDYRAEPLTSEYLSKPEKFFLRE